MQLNVYIPRDKEHLLKALADESERTGRSKNELVLEAIEQRVVPRSKPDYRTFRIGVERIDRASLYRDRIP